VPKGSYSPARSGVRIQLLGTGVVMQEIADGIYVETEYQGVNVGVIVTDEGLVCIDAPSYPRDARHWMGQLSRLFLRPIRHLILTDGSGDRVLNARWLSAPIVAHKSTANRLSSFEKRYPAAFIESLVERNSSAGREISSSPVDRAAVSFSKTMTLNLGGHRLLLQHAPGPSPTTIWVHLPDQAVLFSSDLICVGTHPPLSECSFQEWATSLDWLSLISGPRTTLVPGRGPFVSSEEGAALMRPYLALLDQLILSGRTLEHAAGIDEEILDALMSYFDDDGLPPGWVRKQLEAAAKPARRAHAVPRTDD
jgi:glyoxylase-like metal-dependent hydrolase (beta-lactamase superfamily II)